MLATSNGAATAWIAVALLGIGQGTTTLLRPLVLSRRLDPLVYGRGAAQSAAWSTVARAVAPLLLAGAAGLGAEGYPIGFAVFAVIGIAGAVVAHHSLLIPPPVARPGIRRHRPMTRVAGLQRESLRRSWVLAERGVRCEQQHAG